MERRSNILFMVVMFIFSSSLYPATTAANTTTVAIIDVGVILDLSTLLGKKSLASISMAVDDFYASHSKFSTSRLILLHPRDSYQDVVGAASAAVDLLLDVKVQAIIGPITSSQAVFVADLGSKTQVPIISFSATSPSLSSFSSPYFIRTTPNDSFQVGAISAIVKSYGWRQAVPIYEDSEYGRGIIPSLIDAFTSINTRVPYRSVLSSNASDDFITGELYKLMAMQTRVFIVHMMPGLGSRLFLLARAAGLMSQGYTWITTDSLANVFGTLDSTIIESMEGVVGVRQYIPKTPSLTDFIARWRAHFLMVNPSVPPEDPTALQLWAYDATWALALAAEKTGTLNMQDPPHDSDNSTDLSRLRSSQNGPQLLAAITSTQFHGISGDFLLVDGECQSSAFEIVNVVGNGIRIIGFWLPAVGITTEVNSNSTGSLKTSVIWPGDSMIVPKGWEIPTMGKKLLIGVPASDGFSQFVKVEKDNVTGQVKVTGYSIDVFAAVMSRLEYAVTYEFEPFDGSYDELIYQVFLQKYDAVVGDLTIIANRSNYVDFTLPYTESGVSMIVPLKVDRRKIVWIFLKPLTADLWLASLTFFFFTGIVVWVIEHRINKEFRGPPSHQLGTIFYFAFSTLVFAHKERLESNLSRFLVIVWVFVVLILTSSYTANLTSMLTVQQVQPMVTDVSELIKNGDNVGYPVGAFVKELLIGVNISENQLKNYSTPEQYAEALSKGSMNGGVAAIFDEIPYLKVVLSKYCANFTMVGPTYKTAGFGFVFPRGSPLVPDISRAILNVTEGDEMIGIERKWLGDQITCPDNANSISSSSLNFESFESLFLITGAVSLLALLFFLITFLYKNWDELKAAATQTSLWKRMSALYRHFDGKDLSSHTFRKDHPLTANDDGSNRTEPDSPNRNEPAMEISVIPDGCQGLQSPISVISNTSDMNLGTTLEEEITSIEESRQPINVSGAESAGESST